MILRALKLVGRGPTGPTIFELDDIGLKSALGHYLTAREYYNVRIDANSVDTFIETIHDGLWQVVSVSAAITVVGGSGATVNVVVCPGAVAIASGTAQLSAAIDLTVTAPNNQFGTLIASPTVMKRGDTFGIDMAGTLTGLVGCVTIGLGRVG